MTPHLTSAPGTRTLALTLDEIHSRNAHAPETARHPWISVGYLFLRGFLEQYRAEIKDLLIWPADHVVPQNKEGPRYTGPGLIYAEHHRGTTLDKYERRHPDPQLFDDVAFVLDAYDPLPLSHPVSKEA